MLCVRCCDRDSLDGTLKRILQLKELTTKEHKGYGLWASVKLLHGDIKQVGSTSLAYQLAVILKAPC